MSERLILHECSHVNRHAAKAGSARMDEFAKDQGRKGGHRNAPGGSEGERKKYEGLVRRFLIDVVRML